MKYSFQKGFTLLEILLVVAAIAILAGIVIIAINPAKQLAEVRNAQRAIDVNTILNGVYQYSIDNNGDLPASVNGGTSCGTVEEDEICTTGGTCTDLTDLGVITADQTYLVSMPEDPQDATANGTGYFIIQSTNGRVTVCAPGAELDATITVTR
ncbi:MAG: type II secretion system protein [Patescibacteria group bacterium]|jgi:type IV pilus assembly protein PilA